jgi:hypothetical protein
MTKSASVSIRLSDNAESAIGKILKAHPYLNSRTGAIEFALIETAKLIPSRGSQKMRDANHYRQLLDQNPSAQVGFSLAASAVYAARYGSCEAQDHGTDEWREIAHDLKSRYGENLDASDVRSEMGKSS